MDLMTALKSFRQGKPFYSDLALKMITNSLGQTARSQFEVKDDFVADLEDKFHIHATMIVAREPFPDSTNRGSDPYPNYPHLLHLPNFPNTSGTSKKHEIKTSKCPVSGALQPAHVPCPTCEVLH
jgi:hypothetical protein